MQVYKHKQVGKLMLLALSVGVAGIAAVLIAGAKQQAGSAAVAGIVLALVGLSMVLFGSLTVEVTQNQVLLSFGPGVIRKQMRVEEIRAARIVRNHWYYGWGIRLTPHGWLWNVSGLDAVELDLKDNRKFRIGTDEPQELLLAIQQVSRISG